MSPSFDDARRVVRSTPHALVRDYLGYWLKLAPRSHEEYYRRWLFSYMSVRQRWEDNVRGYSALRGLPMPIPDEKTALRALTDNRMGMVNNRARWLFDFSRSFWADPGPWYPEPGEDLADCRRRLTGMARGLGRAKVSFVLEMLCPASSEVVCFDSHMLRLYGIGPRGARGPDYEKAEAHWLGECRRLRKPSPVVRHIYWDRLRGREDSRYWSFVFEEREVRGE